jgi:hypothetical protein
VGNQRYPEYRQARAGFAKIRPLWSVFVSAKKRILCISYDESLLTTRKMLLEEAGFVVTPAFGFAEASAICRFDPLFDLAVIGHSIPRADQTLFVEMLRRNCRAPVLAVRRPTEDALPEADFSVDSYEGPEGLVKAVQSALGLPTFKRASSASVGASSSAATASSKKRQSRP